MLIADDQTADFDAAFVEENDPRCRLCGATDMVTAFDLGVQTVGSYFPAAPGEDIPTAPLRLMYCPGCSLVQLSHGCDHKGIYESGNYGYQSGQNKQMVAHLREKAAKLTEVARLGEGDVVVDIGSNDGTFLAGFPAECERIGFDPTGKQFDEFYAEGIRCNWELFNADTCRTLVGEAKLITSLSMLYDLEDPVAFAHDVASCLSDDGYWHFEQCYLPTMLATTGYDTICHEHLTYFSVKTVGAILDQVGMHLVDVELNDTNGGSFAVTAQKNRARLGTTTTIDGGRVPTRPLDLSTSRLVVDSSDGQSSAPSHWRSERVPTLSTVLEFRARSIRHRTALVNLVNDLIKDGNRVGGLGASTKGNTLLQFCGFTPAQIVEIGEINPQKIGRFTPGTNIPIVAEADVWDHDFLIVLPWHFRDSIIAKHQHYLAAGGHLIVPFPEIEVIGS